MNERTLSQETLFDGRIFRVERHQVELPDGQVSVRDVIRHPGAVGVVARTPGGRFVMVRQYRKAIEALTTEIVAGTLDPDETPETCARRELEEETGRRARSMEFLGVIHPSPGYVEERIHLFFAELEPDLGDTGLDEDEFVEAFECGADEIRAMILDGRITDSKTVAAWWFFENRPV